MRPFNNLIPSTRRKAISTIGQDGQWKIPGYLVFLITHTREKVEHYQAIARARSLPFHIMNINRVAQAVHSAEEDTGSAKANALQKAETAQEIIGFCRKDSRYKTALQDLCAEHHIAFDPEKILFVSEDSEIKLTSRGVWRWAKTKLDSFVAQEILNRADNGGRAHGPGAETGPIAAAVGGWRVLFDLFRESANELGIRTLSIWDTAVLTVQRLSDPPEAPLTVVNQTVELHLACNDLSSPLFLPENKMHATRWFLSSPNEPGVPIAAKWKKFLTHDSVRSKALISLWKTLETKNEKNPLTLPRHIVHPQSTPRRKDPSFLVKIVDGFTWNSISRNAPAREQVYNLLTPSPSLEETAALVFPPLTGLDEKTRDFSVYTLFCAIVSKSLEAREAYKPIIVQNDGSWTPIINVLTYLANRGMHGDHLRPAFAEPTRIDLCENVRHICTAHLDILETANAKAMRKATKELLKIRALRYSPFIAPYDTPTTRTTGGIPADPARPTGVVFISASNGNLCLVEAAKAYGAFLATQGANFCWGAGDSPGKGMWAPFTGYRDRGGFHISGLSTPTILKTESAQGRIPSGCHYWEINPNIKDREAGMITAAATLALFPGGVGTEEEKLGAWLVKKYLPEIGRRFTMRLYSPNLWPGGGPGTGAHGFQYPILDGLFGKELTHALIKDDRFCSEKGIHLCRTMDALNQLTKDDFSAYRLMRTAQPA